MKKASIFLIAIILGLSSFAQKVKVLEKSDKKAPEWVNAIVKDYIIVAGSGESNEAAQQNALLKVKERIITSIAENIKTSSEYFKGENSVNGINNMIENYEVSTQTKSADIGYVKGISLNLVEGFYWEKVSENDNIRFYYHIKYPFSQEQLHKLIMEFEKADRELTEQLNKIIDSIPNLNTIEGINESIGSLQKLTKSFIDQRKDKVELGLVKLNEMLKSITIYQIQNQLGEIRYCLKIGDKIFSTAKNPIIKSNCATVTESQNMKTEWIVKYEYSNCYEDPANNVSVSYRFGGVEVKKTFNFDISATKAEVYINDAIILTSLSDDGSNIKSAKCQVMVISKYEAPVVIEKIILEWDGLAPISIENINQNLNKKGNHELNLTINQTMEKAKYSFKNKNTVSGYVYYKSTTGERFTYRIYNQKITTNW